MRIGEHREALITRVKVLSRLVAIALAAVAGSFWFVQGVKGSYYRELADNNRLRKIPLKAPRGTIYDRNGRVLVENLPSYNLLLDRSHTKSLASSLAFAAEALGRVGVDLEALAVRYAKVPLFQPVLLAEGLSLAQVSRFEVARLEHPEFQLEVTHRRVYRLGPHAAHVLGHLGEVTDEELDATPDAYVPGDWVGRRGVERAYDQNLRGHDGERTVVVDSRGLPVDEVERDVGVPGADLTLTLDSDLQQEAERLLEGKAGAVVALEPESGEVLALASSPSYDPNLFARRLALDDWRALLADPLHPLEDRALQAAYPPGSVFKIVMAAAGLAEGVVSLEDRVFCNGGASFYGRTFHCWKRGGHGSMDLVSAIKNSCDVYFYHLGQKLGIERIAKYARLFGFGTATGIDLGGERKGLVPDADWSLRTRKHAWWAGETISVAIGQGAILVTPIQLATMVAAVANGGHIVVPHLVRSTAAAAPPSLPLPAGVLDPVRLGLWRVVNDEGTAATARVAGLDVAGKTGTVQVVAQEAFEDTSELPYERRNHAWFVSYAPAAHPRLVLVVFVEHGGTGSKVAAPIARALYEKYFGIDHRNAAAPS